MTTQLCLVRTRLDLALVTGLVDAGQLGTPARRILVVAAAGETPEAGQWLADQPGFDRLAARYAGVVQYNEAVHPNHPREWRPRPSEEPMWERYFRAVWGLGDGPLEVVAPELHRPPGGSLAVVLADAAVRAYLAGPPAYGPTPQRLPVRLGHRVQQFHYLDVAPPLAPLALAEWGIVATPVPPSRLAWGADDAGARPSVDGLAELGLGRPGSAVRQLVGLLPRRRRVRWLVCCALHRSRTGAARAYADRLRRRLLAARDGARTAGMPPDPDHFPAIP